MPKNLHFKRGCTSYTDTDLRNSFDNLIQQFIRIFLYSYIYPRYLFAYVASFEAEIFLISISIVFYLVIYFHVIYF